MRVRNILIIVFLAMSVQVVAQTRRALVIGLGEYEDKSWSKINGDKDVPYVKAMLSDAGYKDVRTLVNKQATKANIVAAFKKLTKECASGDVVYIHFSGHGQQVTDINGDEKDGWDESWIPYDAYLKYSVKDKGEKHLIDDEINVLLTALRNKVGKEGKILVVVDACHSGSSTRGEDGNVAVRGTSENFAIPVVAKGKVPRVSNHWLTLSACKDYQSNQEMKSPKAGKLTYALYTIARSSKVTGSAVGKFMQHNRGRHPQTPVLTGETSGCRLSDFFE